MRKRFVTTLLGLCLATTAAPTTGAFTAEQIKKIERAGNFIGESAYFSCGFVSAAAAIKLATSQQPIKLGRKSRIALGMIAALLALDNATNLAMLHNIKALISNLIFGIANTYLALRLLTDPAAPKQGESASDDTQKAA